MDKTVCVRYYVNYDDIRYDGTRYDYVRYDYVEEDDEPYEDEVYEFAGKGASANADDPLARKGARIFLLWVLLLVVASPALCAITLVTETMIAEGASIHWSFDPSNGLLVSFQKDPSHGTITTHTMPGLPLAPTPPVPLPQYWIE
jgi:hypothetical protein